MPTRLIKIAEEQCSQMMEVGSILPEIFGPVEGSCVTNCLQEHQQKVRKVTLDDPLLITVWRHENLRSFRDKVRAHTGQQEPHRLCLSQPVTKDSLMPRSLLP